MSVSVLADRSAVLPWMIVTSSPCVNSILLSERWRNPFSGANTKFPPASLSTRQLTGTAISRVEPSCRVRC